MGIRLRVLIAVFVLAGLGHDSRAAERVTLGNGFSMNCNHYAVAHGKTRIYLSADQDNYIEFPSQQIAAVEVIPDPPPPAGPKTPQETQKDKPLNPADLGEMLARVGREHNLDVDLLASVVKVESDGNSRARSHAGAQGLMQLMPGTAAALGVNDSFQAEQNVRGGSSYLDSLLTSYHDNLALALAAYNAGPAAVAKYRGIPPTLRREPI